MEHLAINVDEEFYRKIRLHLALENLTLKDFLTNIITRAMEEQAQKEKEQS